MNLKNSDIVEYLQSKNVDVKSHSSSIDDNAIDMVKKHFGKGTTVQNTEAPKEITEQPAGNEQAAKQEAVATAPQTKNEQVKSEQKPAEKKCHEVYHDAEGHWETVVTGQKWIQDTEGYEEPTGVVVCGCGAKFPDDDAWEAHSLETGHGNYSAEIIYHEGTGHYEDITEQKYVIDKQAWTESVCE